MPERVAGTLGELMERGPFTFERTTRTKSGEIVPVEISSEHPGV